MKNPARWRPSPPTGRDIPLVLARHLARYGLMTRGGFNLDSGESLAGVTPPAHPVHAVLLVGNAGPGLWSRFPHGSAGGSDPLDRWCRNILDACAHIFGCSVIMPSDGPPWAPFQSWALRTGRVHASPIGLLIDPVWGLWHAYRGALLLPWYLDAPKQTPRPSPCASCPERPCLDACPVRAFTRDGFDRYSCRSHLATPQGRHCVEGGCQARGACPVGVGARYPDGQVRFHMGAWVSGA